MSNRNFDSRVIIQRLKAQNAARNIFMATGAGSRIGSGLSADSIGAITDYREGMQSMFMRGTGAGMAENRGGQNSTDLWYI